MRVELTQKVPLELLWVGEVVPGGWERLLLQPWVFVGNAPESETRQRTNTRNWRCLIDSGIQGKSYSRCCRVSWALARAREESWQRLPAGVGTAERSWRWIPVTPHSSWAARGWCVGLCLLEQLLTDATLVLSQRPISSPCIAPEQRVKGMWP